MRKVIFFSLFLLSVNTLAEGWCVLNEGFKVITHGTKSEDVWINGSFEGRTTNHWIQIASTDKGSASVSLALAALMSGKQLSIYVDESELSCASIPSWYAGIRHVSIKP